MPIPTSPQERVDPDQEFINHEYEYKTRRMLELIQQNKDSLFSMSDDAKEEGDDVTVEGSDSDYRLSYEFDDMSDDEFDAVSHSNMSNEMSGVGDENEEVESIQFQLEI